MLTILSTSTQDHFINSQTKEKKNKHGPGPERIGCKMTFPSFPSYLLRRTSRWQHSCLEVVVRFTVFHLQHVYIYVNFFLLHVCDELTKINTQINKVKEKEEQIAAAKNSQDVDFSSSDWFQPWQLENMPSCTITVLATNPSCPSSLQ